MGTDLHAQENTKQPGAWVVEKRGRKAIYVGGYEGKIYMHTDQQPYSATQAWNIVGTRDMHAVA